jgi:hypothetical protein
MKLILILWLGCLICNEINNGLCNGCLSYFVNFIIKLKISVNEEKFEFLYKIDNDLRALLK